MRRLKQCMCVKPRQTVLHAFIVEKICQTFERYGINVLTCIDRCTLFDMLCLCAYMESLVAKLFWPRIVQGTEWSQFLRAFYKGWFRNQNLSKSKLWSPSPIALVMSLSSGWEWIISSVPCPAPWTPALQACQSELSQTDTHRDTVTYTKTHINPEAHHTERTDALVVVQSLLRIFLSCIKKESTHMEKMVCKENQFVRILVWNILGLV